VVGSNEDGDRWTRIHSQDLQGMWGKQRGAKKEGEQEKGYANRALQLHRHPTFRSDDGQRLVVIGVVEPKMGPS
jgi:hypothetical protein